MAKRLSEQEIATLSANVPSWQRLGEEIRRDFRFKDFAEAMTFVNSVAVLAEELDHHPDIEIRWNKVLLKLSTHSAGGLTALDFSLAGRIDAISAGRP